VIEYIRQNIIIWGRMMRIISGSRRGTVLFSPVTDKTRPTTDRVRENIFNIIRFNLPGAKALDLFSGSGGMGIEALSQGAQSCVFVDCEKAATDIIKKNLEKTRLTDVSKVVRASFDAYINSTRDTFDIIFLDPPYHKNLIYEAMKLIKNKGLDNDGCLFVLECDSDEEVKLPSGYEIIREKIYGRVKVSLAKRGEEVK